MRTRIFAAIMLLAVSIIGVAFPGVVYAQFSGSGQSGTIDTVEQTRNARVGDRVVLTGSIKSEIRRAQYLFRDETGEIRVRIEYELWRGREVTTKSRLVVKGRVQSDVRGRFIDAYYFQILD